MRMESRRLHITLWTVQILLALVSGAAGLVLLAAMSVAPVPAPLAGLGLMLLMLPVTG